MDVNKYLLRINVKKKLYPSLEYLSELQEKHLYSIPFENLDIPNRARIILDIEKIYKKIIPTKRGGFCYELNGLFYWLLTELGFKVEMLSVRVYNNEKKELGQEYDHLTLLVHLDKDYLVDVGFGDTFRKPIELPAGEVNDISGTYRIVNKNEGEYELQRLEGEDWLLQYFFTATSHELNDFKNMCNFQQDGPDSYFRTRKLCTIATPTGRITLSDNSLTITDLEIRDRKEFDSDEEFYKLLKEYFSIDLQ